MAVPVGCGGGGGGEEVIAEEGEVVKGVLDRVGSTSRCTFGDLGGSG